MMIEELDNPVSGTWAEFECDAQCQFLCMFTAFTRNAK